MEQEIPLRSFTTFEELLEPYAERLAPWQELIPDGHRLYSRTENTSEPGCFGTMSYEVFYILEKRIEKRKWYHKMFNINWTTVIENTSWTLFRERLEAYLQSNK